MDKKHNIDTGREGEEIAAKYLENLGYKIVDRNLELFCGEIDILAKDKKTFVICEVKSVRGEGFGLAKDLVRYKKQNKLRLLGRAIEQQFPNNDIRIDVIGVHLYSDSPEVEHLKNVIEDS